MSSGSNSPPPEEVENHINIQGYTVPKILSSVNQLDYYVVKSLVGFCGDNPVFRATSKLFGVEITGEVCVIAKQDELDGIRECNKTRSLQSSSMMVVGVSEQLYDKDHQLWVIFDNPGPSVRKKFRGVMELTDIEDMKKIGRGVVSALTSIHSKGWSHKQLTPGHIYFNGGILKIGYAATVYDDFDEDLPGYKNPKDICEWGAAPEWKVDKASDVWHLGLTLLEIAWGGRLYAKNRGELLKMINSVPQWSAGLFSNDDFKDFMIKCLQPNPQNRPTAPQLLGHPFLI